MRRKRLTAETVQSAALAFESVDDVHGSDSLSLGVFRVGDGVTDHVLEEHLENTASLLVDEARDALDTATTSQTADGRLRDALDVVTQHFAMAFGASFAQTFASFTASSHFQMSRFEFEIRMISSTAFLGVFILGLRSLLWPFIGRLEIESSFPPISLPSNR